MKVQDRSQMMDRYESERQLEVSCFSKLWRCFDFRGRFLDCYMAETTVLFSRVSLWRGKYSTA